MQFDFLKRMFGTKEPAVAGRKASAKRVEPGAPGLPAEEELCKAARELLASAGAVALAARVRIQWNWRMRSTAGLAYAAKSLIKLNPRLAAFPGEVDRTLRHELAHLLAHDRAGRKRISPHGPEWRQACQDLGLTNETRTHTLPLPRTERRRPHVYRCPVCSQEVARVVPFRSASACLRCCREHNGGRYHERFRFVKVRAK